ncbi:MAG: EamA family transporter [Geothrix sp.]|uniref:EamA family transporter n=1 Tax=Geothrix sp. TaxID=1962974 RepID=UPI00185D2C44|nr:EamA family transporter [Geothrix sp.]NWJ40904.1 EamA family transporter [Geothrix sp.]WIL21096.1 MAG: EamA family transporter [Geothrix sp.]
MLAWLAYLTVAVVWGSTYFAIALGLASFTPYGMVAARFSVAAVLALALGRLRGEAWPPWREVFHLMVVGALLLGGSNALVSYAELHVSTGLVAVLAALVPLWLAVFSLAMEPLGPKGWAGIALGIAGVAVLVWPSGGLRIHPGGLVAMVAAPLIWAWGTLHGKHFVHGGGLMTNVGLQMLTAALIGLAVAPLSGGFLRGPVTPKALWAIGYLILFGSLLAFSAYIYLAKAWPPAKMGTYAYLNPLVAVLLGSLILHEAFGLREILGMTIILAAVALVQLRQKPASRAVPSEP